MSYKEVENISFHVAVRQDWEFFRLQRNKIDSSLFLNFQGFAVTPSSRESDVWAGGGVAVWCLGRSAVTEVLSSPSDEDEEVEEFWAAHRCWFMKEHLMQKLVPAKNDQLQAETQHNDIYLNVFLFKWSKKGHFKNQLIVIECCFLTLKKKHHYLEACSIYLR